MAKQLHHLHDSNCHLRNSLIICSKFVALWWKVEPLIKCTCCLGWSESVQRDVCSAAQEQQLQIVPSLQHLGGLLHYICTLVTTLGNQEWLLACKTNADGRTISISSGSKVSSARLNCPSGPRIKTIFWTTSNYYWFFFNSKYFASHTGKLVASVGELESQTHDCLLIQ